MMDEQFSVLADSHRRRLLVMLLEKGQNDYIHIPKDLHEGDKTLEVLQIEMRHNHLPKLMEAGFIQWEQDTDKVEKGPRFNEIRPLLEFINNNSKNVPANLL